MTTLAHMLPAERQPDRTWLAVVVDPLGRRHGIGGATVDAVTRRALSVLAHAAGGMAPGELSVSAAAAMWWTWKLQRATWSEKTARRAWQDLRDFCQPAWAPLGSVDGEWMRAYLARMGHLAEAGQRTRWHLVTEFLRWCRRRDLVAEHPAERVDREDKTWVGRRAKRRMGRGKAPLRGTAECHAYVRTARQLDDVQKRVAALLPLQCGLRSGEVRHLRCSDVDLVGGWLWVRACDDDGEPLAAEAWDVKSAASRRQVPIPRALRQDLRELVAGNHPAAYVLRSTRNRGGPYMYQWLQRVVAEVCQAADVRVVCPHGLRVTWATMGVLDPDDGGLGMTDLQVGEALGHNHTGQTARRHYIAVSPRDRVLEFDDETGGTHVALAATGTR